MPELTVALNEFLIDRALRLRATYYLLPAADVLVSYYDDRSAALAKMQIRRLKIANGSLQSL